VNPAADVQYSQSSRIGRAGHSSRISNANTVGRRKIQFQLGPRSPK
jgi:hypothetical protein